MFLFDTNIYIDLLRGVESIEEKVSTLSDIGISSIVYGELMFGAYCSKRFDKEHVKIQGITRLLKILPPTKTTAILYASIKYKLKLLGNPIPENDMWIAATAIEHNLTVLTGDKHFKAIDGLKLELWVREKK